MSSPRSPRRLPRRVYVVRRILVLVLIAAVIALVAFAVRWFWPSGDDAPQSAPTPTPSASATPTPTPEPTPEPVATRLVQVATAVEDCDPTLISLKPSATPQEAEGPITLYLSVTTAQESACTLDLEPSDVIATINAGNSKVWDSSPCDTAVLDEPVTVAPGWVTNVAVEWSGRRSGSNCNGGEDFVQPGDYTLQIATRGGEPGRARVTLTEPPEPEPEDDESDDSDEDTEGDAGDDESDGDDEDSSEGEQQVPESEAD